MRTKSSVMNGTLVLAVLLLVNLTGKAARAQPPGRIPLNKLLTATVVEGGNTYRFRIEVTQVNVPNPPSTTDIVVTSAKLFVFRNDAPVHRTAVGEALNCKVLIGKNDELYALALRGNFELNRKLNGAFPSVQLSGVLFSREADKLDFHGTGLKALIRQYEALSTVAPAGGAIGSPAPSAAADVDPCSDDPDDMLFTT